MFIGGADHPCYPGVRVEHRRRHRRFVRARAGRFNASISPSSTDGRIRVACPLASTARSDPRPLFLVAGRDEARYHTAALRDRDRLTPLADAIDERQTLGLELGCREGQLVIHVTSLSDQAHEDHAGNCRRVASHVPSRSRRPAYRCHVPRARRAACDSGSSDHAVASRGEMACVTSETRRLPRRRCGTIMAAVPGRKPAAERV